MATDWKKYGDNIKSSSKSKWREYGNQIKAVNNFEGLQQRISNLYNGSKGLEESKEIFTSGWQDSKASNAFYRSAGYYYAEAESIKKELEANSEAYKSIIGDKNFNEIYSSLDNTLKSKDNTLEGYKNKIDLYSKYKNADDYNADKRKWQLESKYDRLKTYEDFQKYYNSGDFEKANIPKDEKEYLKRLGYTLEYRETLSSLNAMQQELESIPNNIYDPKFTESQRAEFARKKAELSSKIKKAEARIKEMDNMGDIYTGLNTQITSESGEYAFDQRWSAAKKEMEDSLKLTPEDKRKKMSGQKVEGKEIAIDDIFKNVQSDDYSYNYLHYATEYEQKLYSYIKQNDGEKAAQTYLEELKVAKLDKRLNQALFQKMSDYSAQNAGTAILGSLASVPMSLTSGIEFAAHRLGGEQFNGVRSQLASQSQGFREGTKTHWDGAWGEKVWDFLYDTGMSGIDSAAAAGLSAAAPFLGEALLGGSAAASTYNSALDRGISHGDALLTALSAGVAESLFEHMSISKFLDAGDITKGFTKAGVKQATKVLLTEMGINASEELFTEISNIVSDTLINGKLSNYAFAVKEYYEQGMSPEEAKNKALADFGTQILEAGLSGALMGFGFGSVSSFKGMASSQFRNSRNGGIIKSNGNVETLKTFAANSNVAEIRKAAEKITENSKPSEIGYVFNSLLDNAVKTSVEQMTPVLLENGAKESGSNSAKGWATQIAGSIFEENQGKIANLQYNKVTSGVYDAFTKEGKYGGDKLLNLKNIISTPYLNQKATASEVGTVLNENGIEVPVAADGSGAAIGPVMGDTVKGIASAPRSGEIRTITEAYKQGVAENLEKQRPNPKTAKAEAETKGKTEEEIYFEEYFAKEKQITPEEEQILKDFAKENGLKVEFTDKAVDGKAYGSYADGTIVISRYAKKPMRALFKHEFTHSVENAKGYAKFQEYVLEKSDAFKQWLNLKGYGKWSELSDKITETYKKDKVKYDNAYAAAKADIVADFVGDVLFGEVIDAKGNPVKLDTNFLVELKKNDRNLFQRFVEWVHSILKRLTAKGVVNKDIVKLEQKFKRLAEQSRQQRAKGESPQSEEKQGQYSLAEDTDFEQIRQKQIEVNRLTDEIEKIENSDDFKKQTDLLSKAIDNNDIENGIKAYQQWQKESGYAELFNKRDALRNEIEQWQKDFRENHANNELKKEKEAIEKSGLSEPEYFRNQAVKEFGYTPYFYDAGYILPNGRMLNFSGEKNKHFGSRGQDHRAIGTIYANTQGGEAMVRFMSDGNIRIMAESPGIDLSTEIEPTASQYNTISRFIKDSAKNKYFFVDFTDSKGNVIGSLEYDGILSADEILYDIKDYFKNGTIRDKSKEYGQYSLPDVDKTKYADYDKPITAKDIEVLRSIGRKSVNEFKPADLEKAQKWAYKFWNQLHEKSPFFRAWFGDWRAYDIKTKIPVINKSTAKTFKAGKAENADTGRYISWGDQIKGEIKIKYGTESDVYGFLENIEEIVKNSILLDTNVSVLSSKHKMDNTEFMHSMYSIIEDKDGNECLIKLLVEEAFNDKMTAEFSRAYELQEIKKVATLHTGVHSNNGGLTRQVTTNYSISELFEFVKQYDKSFTPNPVDQHLVNEDGTPKKFYHGTREKFTEFSKKKAKPGFYGRGFYFTTEKSQSNVYGESMEVFLKIENPLMPGETKITKNQIIKFLEAVADNEDYSIENYGTYDVNEIANRITNRDAFDVIQDINATAIGDFGEAMQLFNEVNNTNFDGVITPTETVVYDNTKIKSAEKGTPKANIGTFDKTEGDIQYSLPDLDSTGQKLSQGQRSYFAESKLTDEQGKLLRLFHGTKNGGFTKFSAKYSDDGITLFLTPSRELAGTYTDSNDTVKLPESKKGLARMFETGTDKGKGQSGIYEVYANAKKPYILDCDGASWNKLPFTEKIKGKTNVDTENTFDYKNNVLKTKVTLDGKVYEKTFDLKHIVEKVEKIQDGYHSKGFNKEKLYKYEFADQAAIEVRDYYKTFANEEIADDLTSTATLCMELLDGITRTTKKVIDNKTGEIEQLNTRYVSKWAKENGYDAVWFKNVRDTGAVNNNVNTDFIADVVVVFDGSQIKSVDNLNPTKNKDIRYSLPDDGIPKIARGKSYKELDALVKEGKITSDEAFKALGEENGTMPKGERPKVDVNVPEKVSKTKNVNQFMRNVLESGHLDADMTEREKRNIISGARTYKPISDKAALDRAEKKIKADVNGAVQEWENAINGNRRITKYDIALGEQLLVQAAETGNANDVTRYVAELAELGTQLGQDIQALRLLKQMTGMGQLYYVTRAVARLNKDIESRYGEKHKIVEIDPNLANILANAKSEAEIDDVVKDLIKDVASQVKSSWVDKFNSWRYLAMLGNPRTHFRNIVGNAVFVPAVGTKNKIAAIMETMFVDKENRTKTFGFLKPEYRDFATEDFKKVEEIIKGGGKMNPADQIRDQMKVYNSKDFAWLEGVRQFNFNALETEDGWFLKGHYIRALGGAMQARGLDVNNIKPAQLEELRTYAIKEAQKATYRDASHFAQTLNKLAHPGKDASLLSKAAGVAVEGLLPFKKTPINILKRGIEYSPVGVATSIAEGLIEFNKVKKYEKMAAKAEAEGNKTKAKEYKELAKQKGAEAAAQFIDSLSAGLTGTGIMLLGALCSLFGLITGGLDYEDEDALERLAGAQPYAINIGDYSYTIDFAAPAVLPFMIGAETAKIFNNESVNETLGFFDAVAAMGAPMTELSMLQGLNDAIETIAYSDNKMGDFATNIFASYFSQYVPTLGGQIARTFDSTRRTNFVDKNSSVPKIIQTTFQKSIGKVPYFENKKVPYIDAWGRTEENDNILLRAFENFVSPGYISKVTDDSVNNELAKIYTDTGESGVIPKRAKTSFEVSGETVNLNADEYVQYATDRGQYSRRYMEEVMSNSMYQALSSDGKAEVISDLFSYANAKAKSNVSDYDYTSVSTYQTAAKLEAAGVSPTSYYIAREAMSVQNADRDGSGTVSKSEKKKALREAGFSSREINTILNVNKK